MDAWMHEHCSSPIFHRAAQHDALLMPLGVFTVIIPVITHASCTCRKKKTGGVSISTMAPLTHLDNKMVERILQVVSPVASRSQYQFKRH